VSQSSSDAGTKSGQEQLMRKLALFVLISAAIVVGGCHKNKPPVARPAPPPPSTTANQGTRPPAPPEPVAEPTVVPPEPVRDDAIAGASLDELNRNPLLKPVFYELDSSDVNAEGQSVLNADAAILKKYATWTVTIEGHCDERGSAEYNLALGERRAVAARAYLVSLGIAADRLRTVSYGKEFPFDPGHDEAAFAKNRRAHFVITAK
jgi:peptidoglycan-associated lipoprotein